MVDDQDLERRLHEDLRRLPAPKAPRTLLPRVLSVVDVWANRPWYTRAWFAWPLAWQIVSVALLAGVVYGAWRLPPAPPSVIAAAGATRVIWDALVQPFLPYLVVIMVLMGLACALFGAALNYVLLERVEQRR